MRDVEFDCPSGTFPASFEGAIALQIDNMEGPGSNSLWLVFNVARGSTVRVLGMRATADTPKEVAAQRPLVVASADRVVWQLLIEDEQAFYNKFTDSKIKIAGDYRIFGRYSLSFLRAIQNTSLWSRIDDINV